MQLPGIVNFRLCTLSDQDLAEAVAAGLNKMYKEPVTVPSRQIPARPNEDFDLLVGELIVRFLAKIDILKEANFEQIMQALGDSQLAHFGNGEIVAAFKARDVEAILQSHSVLIGSMIELELQTNKTE